MDKRVYMYAEVQRVGVQKKKTTTTCTDRRMCGKRDRREASGRGHAREARRLLGPGFYEESHAS